MKSEKYKSISSMKNGKRGLTWTGKVTHKYRSYNIFDPDERKCAFRLDMKRIELGLEPINILKRK
jgi:hypothetical protein